MPAPVEPAPRENSKIPQIPASIGSSPGGPPEDVSSARIRTEPPQASGRPMIRLLVAAAFSTLLASVLVEYFGSPFRIPESVIAGIGVAPTPEQSARVGAAQRVRAGRNSSVTFALIGAALGLSFGSALGIGRRSLRAFAANSVGGLLCGAASGAIAGAIAAIVVPVLFPSLEAEHKTILAEASSWAITGIGVGLGVSLALHCRRALANGALGGFAGGLIGGVLYFPVVALLIPAVDTDLLIPDLFVAKLVWIALPAIGMALGMGRAPVRNGLAPVDLDGQSHGSRQDAPTPDR
jgi:hypothetical protein